MYKTFNVTHNTLLTVKVERAFLCPYLCIMDFENIILPFCGEVHIELDFGMRTLQKFLSDLDLAKSGFSANLSEDYAKQKAANQMQIVNVVHAGLGGTNSDTRKYVAVHKISGAMSYADTMCNFGIEGLIGSMQEIQDSKEFLGSAVQVNTGGGESFAGQKLHAFMQSAKKPIVVNATFMASAGIMGTLAADEITANSEYSQFGSVGTYLSLNKKFLEFYNENIIDLYAKDSTDKNKAFREALKGDYSMLQNMVDATNNKFVSEVQKFRGVENKNGALNGKMFDAKEAKKLGFIDSVGNLKYSISRVQNYATYGKRKRM